jgi:Cft2 family RNA processing exonuclease
MFITFLALARFSVPLLLAGVVSQSPPCIQSKDTDRLVVTPLGAAQAIGASCFRVEIGPYEIVLDCGTRPKGKNSLPALSYLNNPELLLISHAHQDHIGAVPVFHSRFPGARMICTLGTREIAHVMFPDCLQVQQLNSDFPELFAHNDLERTLFHLETEPIGQDFEPLPGLTVRFINAGHIMGAACIYLRYGQRSLLYTGDYNITSSRTTEGLKLADLPQQVDMLITESTYGADTHPSRKAQETQLLKAILSVVQQGGNVLIPTFALGRAQEILLAIRTSNLFQNLQIPIYVDRLVRAVTDTFRDNLDLLPDSVQNLVKNNGIEPFFDHKATPQIIPINYPQERTIALSNPSVIIASSGMLTGGLSVYYAKTLLERENAAIFISGYTDEESLGPQIQNIQTGDTIELDGQELTVRASIKRFNLSTHADKVGLTQVINKVNPLHLILIHGALDALHELAHSSDLRSKHYIHIPSVGDEISVGVVPEHLNSKQIARIESPQEFEVEVSAEAEGAWIRIPESVVALDPRWQILADNGVMKAKWDGINLKLCPVDSQQQAILDASRSGVDCCAVCQYFDANNSQCQCPNSPLSELVVDPAGYCLEYAASL